MHCTQYLITHEFNINLSFCKCKILAIRGKVQSKVNKILLLILGINKASL